MQFDIHQFNMPADIDMDKGISRSAGLKDVYIETLEAFVQDGNERMSEIPKCLDTGDLGTYAIHVHGIKSALYVIGADEMSNKAYDLELAASKGDSEYIKTRNDAFIEKLSVLVDKVHRVLTEPVQSAKEPVMITESKTETENPEVILTELKKAILSHDSANMNIKINRLLKMSKGTSNNATFRKISNYILVCEYDEALKLLESLMPSNGSPRAATPTT